MTVYQRESARGIFSQSSVKSWDGWPEDVAGTLRGWNQGKRLGFVYLHGPFQCHGCGRLIDTSGSTAANFDRRLICDDCLIRVVRKYGALGRPETPLEEAKRWQRNQQKKLDKYRHNARTEHAYVQALKEALRRIAEPQVEPRDLEAQLVQAEASEIARLALATRVCPTCFGTVWIDGVCAVCKIVESVEAGMEIFEAACPRCGCKDVDLSHGEPLKVGVKCWDCGHVYPLSRDTGERL